MYIYSELTDNELKNSPVSTTLSNMIPWYMECLIDFLKDGIISPAEFKSVSSHED